MYLYEQHRLSVRRIELQIQQLLEKLNQDNKHIKVTGPARPARHHNPSIPDLHTATVQMFGGVNLTSIAGINDSTALRILGEIGNDLSRFPTKKHFVSWVGLSPKNKQSGKMKKRVKCNASNNAGLIFRQSAQSLLTSKNNAIGVFMKRIKGRKGSKVESTPKSIFNHKEHKTNTNDIKKTTCFTAICVLCEFPLCSLW